MIKKLLTTLLILLGGSLLLIMIAALWFREPLILRGANIALANAGIEITELRELQVNRSRLQVAQVTLNLPSGQVLEVGGLDLRYLHPTLRSVPQLQSLAVTELRLRDAETPVATTSSDSLLLSDILRLLRDFPLSNIAIDHIEVPQWQAPMQLTLVRSDEGLELDLASGALHTRANFLQATADDTAQLSAALTRDGTEFGTLQLSLEPMSETYVMDGRGRLVFDDLAALIGELQQSTSNATVQNLPVVPLQSADLSWSVQGQVADDLYGTLRSTDAASFTVGIGAQSALVLTPNALQNLGQTELQFPRDVSLTITTGAGFGVSEGHIPVQLRSSYAEQPLALAGEFALDSCLWSVSAPCGVGYVGSVDYGSYGFTGSLNLTLPEVGAALGNYKLRTSDLSLRGLPYELPGFDIDATLAFTPGELTFSTPLLIRGLPNPLTLNTKGNYAFTSGALEVQVDVPPLTFSEGEGALSTWVEGWSYPADLLAGELQGLAATVHWQADAPLRANVHASLLELGGFYETFFFSGLNGVLQADIVLDDALKLSMPATQLRMASIDVGVPITNVALDFELESATQTLIISRVQAEAVGGTLTGDNLRYDLDADVNELTLRFNSLDLAQMLNMIEYKGVQATGKLSGVIPLTLGPDGVLVTGGSLRADDPGGTLRYVDNGAAAAAGNAQLDLVNQVLSNFQYHTLASSIDYTADGELQLGMQLQGHNPDLGSDQPINLNLNVSDDVPALLNSLRAARDIEQFLEQYQR